VSKLLSLKHADIPDSKFDPHQLAIGVKKEAEHTDDPEVAKAIAKAHLHEIPDYYTRLDKMEAEAKSNGKNYLGK
jgi:hypothetical protein